MGIKYVYSKGSAMLVAVFTPISQIGMLLPEFSLYNLLKTYDQNLYNSRTISFLALCAVVLAHVEKRKVN